MNNVVCQAVNFNNPNDCQAFWQLMNHYAADPMGGGVLLNPNIYDSLIAGMQSRVALGQAFSYFAIDKTASTPTNHQAYVGLINAFVGFSTFYAKPLINIHDIVVLQSARGQGVARLLLNCIKQQALALGCCKLTLEVLSGNTVAQQAYQRFGFKAYQLNPSKGQALFLEYKL